MGESVIKVSGRDDEVELLDYLVILAKHSRMIIYTSLVVVVLTYLILFILPNKYTAKASLMPPQPDATLSGQILESLGGGGNPTQGAMGLGGGLGGMAAGLMGLKLPGDIYVGIMKGNTIFDQIIARFKLRKLYDKKFIEDVRVKLGKVVKIEAGKDGIIVIEVTDKNPKRAAEMANAFMEELDKLLQDIAVREAKERLVFLEKERSQTGLNLAKAEEAVRVFSEKSSIVQIDAQAKGVIEYIASLRAAIDAKEVQIQVLRKQATPYNYDVIRLETEITGLREKLRAAESEGDKACVTDVCLATSKVPSLGLEYLRLYREIKFQESLYQLYTKLVEIARLDIVRDAAVVKVVDFAKPPESRSNRRLLPSVIVGLATFFLMVLVAFGREHLQQAKNKEKDAQRLSLIVSYLTPQTDLLEKIKNIARLRRKS